jgi:parallel beta-helix repeat protein
MRRMKTKFAVFVLILLSALLIAELMSPALGCKRSDFESVIETSQQVIYIRTDGNIDPSTAPIRRDGNRYTFTGDIDAQVVVDKDNIVIDGAGYSLNGPYNGTQTDLWIIGEGSNETSGSGAQIPWTAGIDMRANTRGVTIQNLNIKNFSIGIWLWTTGNTINGNALTENLVGILLSGVNNTITANSLAKNRDGIFFGANQPGDIPTNITLSGNSFVDNSRHLSGCVCEDFNNTETAHTWDDGQTGNFWSGYVGADSDDDGIGDTPYIVDALNLDRYPLMENAAVMPTVAPQLPFELIAVMIVLALIAVVAVLKRPKKNRQ